MAKTVNHMQAAFNRQINNELANSAVYLSMAAWCESQDLKGIASHFRKQSDEERSHAMKLFDHAADRFWLVSITGLALPPQEWASVPELLTFAYMLEQKTTADIKGLVALAEEEHDSQACQLLLWFANEQVQEEADIELWLSKAKRAGEGVGLYLLDREMGGEA